MAGTNGWQALREEAQALREAGRHAEAIPVAERALALVEQLHGADEPVVAVGLSFLAELYQQVGMYAKAEPLIKRAVEIYVNALGLTHWLARRETNNLATCYFQQGQYSDAEQLLESLISISETLVGSEHPEVGAMLHNLAAIYDAQGRYRDAETLYKRVLSIREKAFGHDDEKVATTLNNLAECYRVRGRHADAEPLLRRALSINEKALGSDHPKLAVVLNNLAEVYKAQGRYADAEALYKRDLSISEKGLGSDHPDVATTLTNLAGLHVLRRQYADAESLLKRALSINEKALGSDHQKVSLTLAHLAELYQRQGRYVDAESLYKRTLSINERVIGPYHSDVGAILNNLATLYVVQTRYADAEPLLKRALSINEKALGSDHPNVAAGLTNIAEVYKAQGRYADAEALVKRALSITEKAVGPDHPDLPAALNNLADCYRRQGRYADAEQLFERAQTMAGWEVTDVPILFATNRAFELVSNQAKFGAKQKSNVEEISFGKAIVRAPRAEVLNRADRLAQALGQLDRAIGRQTVVDGLAVRSVVRDEGGAGLAAIARDRLSRAARFPSQAFVFVHGYNTTFEDAVRRTAMIAFDLDFDGATFLFTWPSQGKLTGYAVDRKRARIAAPFLLALLQEIGTTLPDVKVHLLAHSTGAEIVLSVLSELTMTGGPLSRPQLGELILAHADVSPARLARVMPSIKALGVGVTSYSSAADWAMRMSQTIRLKRARVGSRPVHILGVDAIDISGLSGGPLALNHTVFVDNPLVFGDMARLMASGERPPDKRTPFFAPVTTRHGTHWQYRPPTAT